MLDFNAYAIVIEDNPVSEHGYRVLCKSSKNVGNGFAINRFDAITADQSITFLAHHGIRWNWPWESSQVDIQTGLHKVPYQTSNRAARIACFASHYSLWIRCLADDKPILILEHDAVFTRKFDLQLLNPMKAQIIGINDPRGATRKSALYHQMIQSDNREIQPVPRIDKQEIAQGLAGNSAYIITPKAAEKVIQDVDTYGAWPNDAIICYQINPHLRVTRTYYTAVQGLRSTTTL